MSDTDELAVEARVTPLDIDQLELIVRLIAFNQQTTPELVGSVTKISADLSIDERTGMGYYEVGVKLSPAEVSKLSGLKLTAGMPAEVFFPTGNRSIFSYLAKPVTDQLNRAFRET